MEKAHRNKQYKNKKVLGLTCKQKGITLIALVLTIIVLIILATVAINMPFGQNGIINRAEQARNYYSSDYTYTDDSLSNVIAYLDSISEEETSNNYTNEQKAIREVINAYYNKGENAQYCSYRKSFSYSPEEATTQHTIYSVCSNFTFSVYYQAFGIKIPYVTQMLITYGKQFYGSSNDVIEYWQRSEDENGNVVYKDNNGNIRTDITEYLSTNDGKKEYAFKLLQDLEIGDIIVHTGHAMLVYDIIYDENGTPIDALIRESWATHFNRKNTKITKGLSYGTIFNSNYNFYEGTFQERYLINEYENKSRGSVIDDSIDKEEFTIIRPLLKDENGNYTGKYYYATFAKSEEESTGYVVEDRILTDYKITDTTLNRINYSEINIEKTVDVFNDSEVNLGDSLEYTIKITNYSDTKYNSFDVVENISDYVEIIDNGNGTINGNIITWNIQGLETDKSVEIKYTVKVKENNSLLGNKIISTGTVAGIPSSTITNSIFNNLSKENKISISDKTESLINSGEYIGQELISQIYNELLGVDLQLESLDISDLIKTKRTILCTPSDPSVYLNMENSFYNMVLSNYWGSLYTNSLGTVNLRHWEDAYAIEDGRSERADTIYNENFQTGDILIYQNTQTANDNVTYKTENGTYYLIYIDEKNKITINGEEMYGFIGINENKEINYISTDFMDLQTLLGKDYFVILRPSKVLN